MFFADLFLIAIVEGGLNLFFFTEGNQLGMLGAFFQALLIAAANIVVVRGDRLCAAEAGQQPVHRQQVAGVWLGAWRCSSPCPSCT